VGEEGPQLVQAKAVDTAYPLRGRLKIRDDFEAPDREVETGPPPGQVWVESRLLRLLDSELGETVGIGESRLPMGAILSYEPDRGGALFAMAPRVMLNQADLEATGLISEASRAEHRLLVAGEAAAVERFKKEIQGTLPVNIRLIDGSSARPEFESAVDRASRFLHLATLVTLSGRRRGHRACQPSVRRASDRRCRRDALSRGASSPLDARLHAQARAVRSGRQSGGLPARLARPARVDEPVVGLVRDGSARRLRSRPSPSVSRPVWSLCLDLRFRPYSNSRRSRLCGRCVATWARRADRPF
jgi:hypothetical protein